MPQIVDWLEKLGMSEYAQRFAENRIDFSVLGELTDQDLKELGFVLGDRRKMLRAIADIDGIEKNAPATPDKATAAPRRTPVASEPIPTATPPPISAAAEVSGERRCHSACNIGSDAFFLSLSAYQPGLKQIDFAAAVHLPSNEF